MPRNREKPHSFDPDTWPVDVAELTASHRYGNHLGRVLPIRWHADCPDQATHTLRVVLHVSRHFQYWFEHVAATWCQWEQPDQRAAHCFVALNASGFYWNTAWQGGCRWSLQLLVELPYKGPPRTLVVREFLRPLPIHGLREDYNNLLKNLSIL